MGTRANIIYDNNNFYQSIYVGLDGYVSQLGRKLLENFKEPEVNALFSHNQAIDAISDLSREEMQKQWSLKEDKNLDNYSRRLNQTDNYIVNAVMVKQFTKSGSKDLIASFSDGIFQHATEQYVYLFSKDKWYVAGFDSEDFLSLEKVVPFSKDHESIIKLEQKYKILSDEKEGLIGRVNTEEIDKLLEKIREKSFLLIKKYNKEEISIQSFVEKMLNLNDLDLKQLEVYTSEHCSFMLSKSLSENLKNKTYISTRIKL